MINTLSEYKHYLERDKIALGIGEVSFLGNIIGFLSPNLIWKFQKTLRKLEYYTNCKNKGFYKIYIMYLKLKFKKISLKLGFSIPINVFGPGLAIVHYGTIVVNSATRVGENCRMHACVNIGASGGEKEAPQLGDNIYIAPGAKIYGNISVANNTAIGANAVVHKTSEEKGVLLAGNPAIKIKEIDIKRIIKHL
ncbi:serine O-acetyltransferase [Winogradskyella sp. PG-2]|uniref:serine O-acetyltransferase n=1 Tax=Winogradskyella sp. PG-2 TaxID=754409 RepID=UPI0004588EF1|nr:serine acetyltransferase [Winogradskyella sp. PG-2]BAO77452.1 serine O-acetyltransferase [Winogradskyella sp. PG-2]